MILDFKSLALLLEEQDSYIISKLAIWNELRFAIAEEYLTVEETANLVDLVHGMYMEIKIPHVTASHVALAVLGLKESLKTLLSERSSQVREMVENQLIEAL